MRKTHSFLALVLVALCGNGRAENQSKANPGRPNIIIVMADDMGFSDLGCYGGEIETPTIDRLASGGVRFSQFYNCALCGPSRASLMTGCYAWNVGQAPGTRIFANLKKNCATVIELLKANGYATCAVGVLIW
jgi:arylsulfatase